MQGTKSYNIPRQLIVEAYEKVRSNGGAGGIDNVSMDAFEKEWKNNLYKLWNRMSSGSYHPMPVKLVEIPKEEGGVEMRTLVIPTILDRLAQAVVFKQLEAGLEHIFHTDSYGYRPDRSAHQAVEISRRRCWRYDWVLDLDIRKFFDTIDHELLMKAVRRHTNERWILLYIERWLKVPYENKDGSLIDRVQGVPQGSVAQCCPTCSCTMCLMNG